MKKIVFKVESVNLSNAQQVLRDAIYEYVSHRGPTAHEYVERRYSDWPSAMKDNKTLITNQRIIVANDLLYNMTVEEE